MVCLRAGEAADDVRRATDGMDVDVVACADGARTLLAVGARRADLLLIPAQVPVVATTDVVAAVRQMSGVPIVVTVAEGEADMSADALAAGATRLVGYPYAPSDLQSVLREYLSLRHHPGALQRGNLRVDPLAYEVTLAGRRIPMSARELEVLMYLMRHSDRAVSPEELRQELWPTALAENTKAITSTILRLRTHFATAGASGEIIQTIRGHGYRLFAPAYT